MLRSWISPLLAGLLAATLAGCGAPRLVEGQVQSFSTLTAAPAPATYRIERLPSQQTPAKRWAALCLASHESGLPETPITSQPLFLIAVTVVFISAVSPLLEMQMTTSPGTSCPQEPCTASVPCRK